MPKRKSHFERAQERVPEGYRLESWMDGTGRTFRIVRLSDNQRIITGQKRPGAAVDLLLRRLDPS